MLAALEFFEHPFNCPICKEHTYTSMQTVIAHFRAQVSILPRKRQEYHRLSADQSFFWRRLMCSSRGKSPRQPLTKFCVSLQPAFHAEQHLRERRTGTPREKQPETNPVSIGSEPAQPVTYCDDFTTLNNVTPATAEGAVNGVNAPVEALISKPARAFAKAA